VKGDSLAAKQSLFGGIQIPPLQQQLTRGIFEFGI
jgi:hypothetical protein